MYPPSSSDSHHHHFPIAVLPSSTALKFTPTHPQQHHSHATTTAFVVVSNLACSFSAPLDLIVNHEGQKEAGRGGGKHILFAFSLCLSLSLMCVALCVSSSSSYLLCCFCGVLNRSFFFLGFFLFFLFLLVLFCFPRI